MKNEYERTEEIEAEDIPEIIGLIVILTICLYGLIRFWH